MLGASVPRPYGTPTVQATSALLHAYACPTLGHGGGHCPGTCPHWQRWQRQRQQQQLAQASAAKARWQARHG